MLVAFDVETWPTEPGLLAPPLVCLSWTDGRRTEILDEHGAGDWFAEMARKPNVIFVGHRVAYDFAVLAARYPSLIELIFDVYATDRVKCTFIRERLLQIAAGVEEKFSLETLVGKYLGQALDKSWQLRFREVHGLPISTWPREAVQYSKHDAEAELAVCIAQDEHAPSGVFVDEFRQSRAAFALHLTECWGLRTDPVTVAALEERTHQTLAEAESLLRSAGMLQPVTKGRGAEKIIVGWKKAQKKAHERAETRLLELGLAENETYRTPAGKPSLAADVVDVYEDAVLTAYNTFATADTIRSRVEDLKLGTERPIHTHFDPLKNTGRVGSSGEDGAAAKNLQNVNRKGGVRECFVPRPGMVYCAADYGSLELHTLAQVCIDKFGESTLADLLNDDVDVHMWMAAKINGVSLEEMERRPDRKDARQFGKVANFGLPGGLGPAATVTYAWSNYRLRMTEDQARDIRAVWREAMPIESVRYHAWVNDQIDPLSDRATIVMDRSGRIRGGCSFTQAANQSFQGLGADTAKDALWRVTRACFIDRASPLFGCRPVLMVHDEIIIEAPRDRAPEAAVELGRLMEEAGREWMPDCPPRAVPFLMERWTKDAEPTFGPDGRLVPWKEVA